MKPDQSNEKILQLINNQINLPSPPSIAAQILNTVQDENSSLKDLEKIISADPALTGKMLHIANSAFLFSAKQSYQYSPCHVYPWYKCH